MEKEGNAPLNSQVQFLNTTLLEPKTGGKPFGGKTWWQVTVAGFRDPDPEFIESGSGICRTRNR